MLLPCCGPAKRYTARRQRGQGGNGRGGIGGEKAGGGGQRGGDEGVLEPRVCGERGGNPQGPTLALVCQELAPVPGGKGPGGAWAGRLARRQQHMPHCPSLR